MKKISVLFIVGFLVIVSTSLFSNYAHFNYPPTHQSNREKKLIADSKNAQSEFIKSDGLMRNLFNSAYAYVIFPNIGKGGFGFGGATGNGVVYKRGSIIGTARMTQITIGFQAGGQAYREVIFFENERTLNEFTDSKFEFSAQASAIIVAEGAAANVKYNDGVMIFTQPKAGLMYEASVGGQKFTYKAF